MPNNYAGKMGWHFLSLRVSRFVTSGGEIVWNIRTQFLEFIERRDGLCFPSYQGCVEYAAHDTRRLRNISRVCGPCVAIPSVVLPLTLFGPAYSSGRGVDLYTFGWALGPPIQISAPQ